MANAYQTTQKTSQVAAARLKAATPTYGLIAQSTLAQDLQGVESIGDSVDVLIPDDGDVRQLTEGDTTTASEVVEGKVTLTMDTHLYDLKRQTAVDAAFRGRRGLGAQVDQAFGGSIQHMGEAIDGKCINLAHEIPYWVGSPGTAIDTSAKAFAGMTPLIDNRGAGAPMTAIFSTQDYQTILTIPEFLRANERGNDNTMRSGFLGDVGGISWMRSRAVATPTKLTSNFHVAGTFEAGSPLVNVAVLEDATSMAVDGGGGTETLKVGDLFTVDGAAGTNQFVIKPDPGNGAYDAATKTYTATAGAIASVKFYPPAPAGGFADDTPINLLADHRKNLLATPGCLAAVVIPPLAIAPLTGQPETMMPFFHADSGIGLALTTYERQATTLGLQMSIDTFFGGVLVAPEKGVIHVA